MSIQINASLSVIQDGGDFGEDKQIAALNASQHMPEGTTISEVRMALENLREASYVRVKAQIDDYERAQNAAPQTVRSAGLQFETPNLV